jgi:hypothetical protein
MQFCLGQNEFQGKIVQLVQKRVYGPFEIPTAEQNLYLLRSTVFLAQKMGCGLG